MPLLRTPDAFALLRCVACEAELEPDGATCTNAACAHARVPYRTVEGQPVLIDAGVVDRRPRHRRVERAQARAARRRGALRAFDRPNAVAARVGARLAADLAARGGRRTVLVIGGGTIGSGLDALYDRARAGRASRSTSSRPRSRSSSPTRTACRCATARSTRSWCRRCSSTCSTRGASRPRSTACCAPDGLVYADTPFLQPVHEGPYDFTRFTESGHRWLFRDFALIESGVVAGPGDAVRVVARAGGAQRRPAARRRAGGALRGDAAGTADRPLRGAGRPAVDGASAVYFYGRRADRPLAPRDMIAHYRGAQGIPARRPRPTDAALSAAALGRVGRWSHGYEAREQAIGFFWPRRGGAHG